MPSLKDLRNRIASVKATQKITKAMQMVAAAKLRRAQAAAEAARPYAERMSVVLSNVAAGVAGRADAPRLLAGTGSDATHLLIVCTAERGLCGAFNSSIARLARDQAIALQRDGKIVKILCVGKKGYDLLRRQFKDQIIELVELRSVRQIGFNEAEQIGRKVLSLYQKGEFDVATLFYAKFRSVIQQLPTAQQIIPAEVTAAEEADGAKVIYEYEPDEAAILEDLLPRNVSIQILSALLENVASEMGAKMSAMDNATRNAGEMIKKYTLRYNRTRQAMITKELIEIISGAEAL
ncbi:F-type H+-transporting ATPase subunit gamma [Kaistia hirudinis]|uniref:ATP synthase gamma chain n=1 Tax=Kaistia hirudinis TaxID=1293440 RepID=A0A840AQB1_9HYPH|nr:F0F1 ATP synthase subunit gamma [Kaistia hirudinis]MBB3931478.1 F-type H+-transporting ATPase subunit gamma [Kaistia hirudinis]MBN9016113.1 F0F1 ATP synthase subunit gamma [Hyphomicrobiales bacterium]